MAYIFGLDVADCNLNSWCDTLDIADVNLADLAELLGVYGDTCPSPL